MEALTNRVDDGEVSSSHAHDAGVSPGRSASSNAPPLVGRMLEMTERHLLMRSEPYPQTFEHQLAALRHEVHVLRAHAQSETALAHDIQSRCHTAMQRQEHVYNNAFAEHQRHLSTEASNALAEQRSQLTAEAQTQINMLHEETAVIY